MFKAPLEEFENVRVVALSVIGSLCQVYSTVMLLLFSIFVLGYEYDILKILLF